MLGQILVHSELLVHDPVFMWIAVLAYDILSQWGSIIRSMRVSNFPSIRALPRRFDSK